jgi:hypothetical protein
MKKLLGIALTIAVVALGVGASIFASRIHDAHAASLPYAQTSTIARHFSSTVAAGALIQTAVFDLANVSECVAYADNSAGGSTRALNVDCMADDGTTVVFRAVNTVAIAGRGLTAWGSSVASASLPTGVVIVPGGTCKKMQFALAAAGAAAGTLGVDCR